MSCLGSQACEVCGRACRAKPPNSDAPVFFPANMCHNLFLSTFLVLRNPGTWNYFTFTISITGIRTVQATKTRTRDYNRAKFALNFSFIGLVLKVVQNQLKNIYNIRPNNVKFLSIIVQYRPKSYAVTRCQIFSAKMHKIQFRLGLRPRTHWGSPLGSSWLGTAAAPSTRTHTSCRPSIQLVFQTTPS